MRVKVCVEEKRHSTQFIHHCCAHLTARVTLFTFFFMSRLIIQHNPGGNMAGGGAFPLPALCMSMLMAIVGLLAGQQGEFIRKHADIRCFHAGGPLETVTDTLVGSQRPRFASYNQFVPLSEATRRSRYVSSRLNTLKSYCCLVGRPYGTTTPQSRRVTQRRLEIAVLASVTSFDRVKKSKHETLNFKLNLNKLHSVGRP